MEFEKLSITNSPMISAIYYALLQCGYNFYALERDEPMVKKLRGFIMPDCSKYGFFSEVRQNSCEVYPYWPRAAMLETATFFVDLPQAHFVNFDAYKSNIQSAKNISDIERNQTFWNWIQQFPMAINHIFRSDHFCHYLEWENEWIAEQNWNYKNDLKRIADILVLCKEKFNSPFQNIQIILNPIKCVYSSDYHQRNNTFIVCLGALREESVIHEFIHHVVHPVIERRKDEILGRSLTNLGLDVSYYLDGGDMGKLNAFEEYMVRKFTNRILSDNVPNNLDAFFDWALIDLAKSTQN